MSFRKFLTKLNFKLESSWRRVDFTASDAYLEAGWYVAEFLVQGAINHIPRIIVEDPNGKQRDRSMIGSHAGRNRMLIFLPKGRLCAFSKSIEFQSLSRVSSLEGRARVLLICARYLADFFSFRVLCRMVLMQFQNREALSTDLLHFYSSGDKSYLQNVHGWTRLRAFSNQLAWWYRGVKIAVLIEEQSQRERLNEQFVKPDYILNVDDSLPSDVDFVLPLSKTEQLREPAILMLKRTLKNESDNVSLVYTDHDYPLTGNEKRQREPVFKPQPSRAYLHCFNYIGPAVLFARSVAANRSLSDLLDDEVRYHLALECFTKLDTVRHISEALFKSYRKGAPATPEPNSSQSPWPDILWQRRESANCLVADTRVMSCPSVDLIIPTRDGLAVLKPCIDSLLDKTDYSNFKVIVVDNGSELAETHDYFEQIKNDHRVRIVNYPGEFNYSAINNFAIAQGNSDYIALVNNDIEVIHSDWLHQMMAWAVQPNIGIVGAKLLFGNGLVQHAGVVIGMGEAAGHIHRLEPGDSPGYQYRCLATQNMMAVTAACLVTPRALFEQLGGLDADNLRVAFNDIDYCLRVEAFEQEVIWTPEARLFHHESVSRGDDMSEQHIERYFSELAVLQKRWKTKGFVDKYYSPHLRVSDEGVYPQLPNSESDELFVL